MDADYYELLGVPRDADQEEIRRAYRRASVRCHPDFNPGDEEAAKKFRQITEAYKVLSDLEKRRRYDQSAGVTFTAGARGMVVDFFNRIFAVEDGGKK